MFSQKYTKFISCFVTSLLGIFFLSVYHKRKRPIENNEENPYFLPNFNLIEKHEKLEKHFLDLYYDLEKTLQNVDDQLEEEINLEKCLEKLIELRKAYPNNTRILWMTGKAYSKVSETVIDVKTKGNLIEKGIEACRTSLEINFKQANAHKWLAILIGSRSLLQPVKEKILDAHIFKHHADLAISLNPSDWFLYFMVGRYCYEVANMKWYEKKIASTLFAEPPSSTFDEALIYLFKAEKLNQNSCKENKLYIGKCYIAMENYKEGLKWLKDASKIKPKNLKDKEINNEIDQILKKL